MTNEEVENYGVYTKYFMYRSVKNEKRYEIYAVFFKKPDNINILEPGWNELSYQGKPLVFRMFQDLTFEQATRIIGFLLDL